MNYKQIGLPAIQTTHYQHMRQFDKDLCREMEGGERSLDALLNAGLRFEDNFDAVMVSVASHAVPGTEFSVAHALGKAIMGYIVYGQTAAGSIFDGVTANTKTTAYFKSDVAGVTFRLLLF